MSAKTLKPADTLWAYIEERERIRLRKEAGEPFPWTEDPILRAFKFTNVRRIHDRTTQAFLAIYQAHSDAPAPRRSTTAASTACSAPPT
jgi:hypothetical protein